MGSRRAELFNNELLHSLSTIQAAKTQFHLLIASNSTPAVLVSQIRLCDALVGEIRAIRCNLEREGRMRCRDMIRRCSVVATRTRTSRHPVVPHGNPENRKRR
jgi:hypothetical protein